jgi:hypothetical protein
MDLTLILLIVAFICFVLGALRGVLNFTPNIDLTALGLAFWVLAIILPLV